MTGIGGEGSRPPRPRPAASRKGPTRRVLLRGVAVTILAATAASLSVAVMRSWKEGARRARHRPPFSAVGARAIRPDGSVWSVDGDLRRPTVLLYVTWSCPHCRVELERWSRILAHGLPDEHLAMWVVAARQPPADFVLPGSLRARVLRDPDAATARALGVDAVPTTVSIAPGGRVVDLVRGATSDERIQVVVDRLLGASTRE